MATRIELESQLAALVDMTFTTLADPETRHAGLAAYHEAVQQLAQVAADEYPPLAALCRDTHIRLSQFDVNNEAQWLLLENWPAVAMGLLSDPEDMDVESERLAWLADPAWNTTDLHINVADAPKTVADAPETVADAAEEDAQTALTEAIVALMALATTADDDAMWLTRYQRQVAAIGALASQVEHGGLSAICGDLHGRLTELDTLSPTDAVRDWLQNGPLLLMSYADAPEDDAILEELFTWLAADPVEADEDTLMVGGDDDAWVALRDAVAVDDDDADIAEFADDDAVVAAEFAADHDEDAVIAELINAAVTQDDDDAVIAADDSDDDDAVIAADDSDDDDEDATLNRELMAILQAEMVDLTEQAEAIAALPPTERQSVLDEYTEAVGRFAEAVSTLNLLGLQQFGEGLQAQLLPLDAASDDAQPALQALLDWPPLVLAYLDAFDRATSQALVQFLQRSEWSQPLDADGAALLLAALDQKPALELPEVEARVREATAADVSLAIPADVNPDLLESLLQELPNQMGQFAAAVQKLVRGQGGVTDLAAAQRIAHTVKGAANTVGVKGIANLTHHLEDIFEALAKANTLPPAPLAELMVEASDCLEAMTESLLGQGAAPHQSQAILQTVLDWANRIDEAGPESLAQLPPLATARATTAAAPQETATQEAAKEAATQEAAALDAIPMLRVPAPLVDEMLRQVGESIILTGQIEARIATIHEQSQAIRAQTQMLKRLAAELEQLVDVRGVLSPLSRSAGQDFDPLEFDQYNELHTVSRRIVELADDAQTFDETLDAQFGALETLLNDQIQLHRDSQETTLRTRMVPVRTVVPRLQRAVRQTCRLVDKDVELVVRGEPTLVDSDVLNSLVDPLMHMLRNAIDHGIESAAVRASRNKAASGRIELSFGREGNNIVVRCRDDGGGLNRQAIRQIAEKRGLVDADQVLTDDMLDRLILQPGFSTKVGTTQVSGRGIGMDVVYQQVLALKGGLLVHSALGEGTTFELRLPVSLISTHALLVEAGDQLFALADRGIEQILYPELDQLGPDYYQMEKERCPLHRLEQLLGVAPNEAHEGKLPTLLLVRDDTGAGQIIAVGPIREARDLVVKPLSAYVPPSPGVLGATILGDGSVSAVLDLPELLRAPQQAAVAAARPQVRRRRALVVDDSLSARRSLAQFVADAGYEVHEARDGLEAVGVLDKTPMDMLLVDMEMPRMNGLELTIHVRNRAGLQHVPIVMITSRSTSKHKAEAEAVGVSLYLTKPFSEAELMSHLEAFSGVA